MTIPRSIVPFAAACGGILLGTLVGCHGRDITGVEVPVATALSTGEYFGCRLSNSGAASCWGSNVSGQLGNPSASGPEYCATHPCSTTPISVRGGRTFVAISSAGAGSCGLGTDGAAFCWGGNWVGQLGNGSTADTSVPVAVSGGLTFASLSAGNDHACGVTRGGGILYCWGARHWLIGNVDTAGADRAPVAIGGGLAVSAVSAGYDHNCAVTSGGAIYCWGSNFAGQLGTGDTVNRQGPTPVLGGLTFTAVSAGFSHTCGLAAGGSAYCWGDNQYGELGDGDTTGYRLTPVPVAGGLTFTSISAGFDVTCGLTSTGAALCWGVNALGLLGNGTTSGPQSCNGVACGSMPIAVVGGHTFVALSTRNSTCALTADGAVYCWGVNDQGQLGDGSTSNRQSPVRVAGT